MNEPWEPEREPLSPEQRKIVDAVYEAGERFRHAMCRCVVAFEGFGEAVHGLTASMEAAAKSEGRRFLAKVYECPEDLLDDVLRVRMADLEDGPKP